MADSPVIQTFGAATTHYKPEQVRVSFAVEHEHDEAAEALASVSLLQRELVQALREGFPGASVATEGATVSRRWRYSEVEEPEFKAVSVIAVSTNDIQQLGSIVAVAFSRGAVSLHSTEFSGTGAERAELEALGRASKVAAQRASTMAEALGVELGTLVRAEEATSDAQSPMMWARQSVSPVGADEELVTLPAALKARATVTVTYSVK